MNQKNREILEHYFAKFKQINCVYLIGPLACSHPDTKGPIIYVDGGSKLRKKGVGISVGDGDSSKVKMDIELPCEKDISDLGYVLNWIPQKVSMVNLIGFNGGRPDHNLINMGEIHHFLKGRKKTSVTSEEDYMALSAGNWTITITGEFSLFLFEKSELSIDGQCKYKWNLKDNFRERSSQGLSNIGHGQVNIVSNHPFFIFSSSQCSF